jgi:hypothetical protein
METKELCICAEINDAQVMSVVNRALDAGYNVYLFQPHNRAAVEVSKTNETDPRVCIEVPVEAKERAGGASSAPPVSPAPAPAMGKRSRKSAKESIEALKKAWKVGMYSKELSAAAGVSLTTFHRIKKMLPEEMRDGLAEEGRRRHYKVRVENQRGVDTCRVDKGSGITPKVYTKEEKEERRRHKQSEYARTSTFLSDKNSIF